MTSYKKITIKNVHFKILVGACVSLRSNAVFKNFNDITYHLSAFKA